MNTEQLRNHLATFASQQQKVQYLTNEYKHQNLAEPDYYALLAEIIGVHRPTGGSAQLLTE